MLRHETDKGEHCLKGNNLTKGVFGLTSLAMAEHTYIVMKLNIRRVQTLVILFGDMESEWTEFENSIIIL